MHSHNATNESTITSQNNRLRLIKSLTNNGLHQSSVARLFLAGIFPAPTAAPTFGETKATSCPKAGSPTYLLRFHPYATSKENNANKIAVM